MSSQVKGLRFDLFERVHVPSFMPAIVALDEMELVPEIECVEENAMVVMRGHFRLSVDYLVVDGKHSFEHLIPVDITLPRRRIERMEDVQVVIETYDAEQMSERELNLNVVVELLGVGREDSQMTASAASKRKKPKPQERNEVNEELSEEPEEMDPLTEDRETQSDSEGMPQQSYMDWYAPPPLDQPFEDQLGSDDYDVYVEPPPKRPASKVSSAVEVEPFVEAPVAAPVAVPVAAPVAVPVAAPVAVPVAVPVAAPEPTDTTQAKTVSGMEWTRTFLRDTQTHNNVGRKRMCIVQKEDSLDSIAARYGIHSQELVMFNRLADRQLQTGQILYIPLSG